MSGNQKWPLERILFALAGTVTLVSAVLAALADDYVTKPFSPGELMARVRAMLRRPRTGRESSPGVRRFGDLEIDPAAREVRRSGEAVELTKIEFDLLDVLSAEPRVAFSRDQLLERVGGGGGVSGSALTTSWMSTSATCAPSSATIRAHPATCERSAASAIAWERVNESAGGRQPECEAARGTAADGARAR